MRFWRSLLAIALGLVLLALIVFALPLVATVWVLLVTMVVSPAVWLSGASYSQGGRQAFFRGGLVCGILPFIVSLSVFVILLLSESTWTQTYYSRATVSAPAPATMTATAPALNVPTPYSASPSPNAYGTTVPLVANDEPSFIVPTLNAPDQTAIPDAMPAISPYSQVTVAHEVKNISFEAYTESLMMRLLFAGLWLAPGVLAFLGGGLSWLTHRLLTRPTASSAPTELDDELRTLTERTVALCETRESNVPSEV